MNKHLLLAFLTAFSVTTAQSKSFEKGPENLGSYQGLLYTGAALSEVMNFEGGTFTECTLNDSTSSSMHQCSLKDTKITVISGETTHTYDFDTVSILVYKDESRKHYYLKGSRTVNLNGQNYWQPVFLTLNFESLNANRLTGYLELREHGIRSALELLKK